MIENNRKTLVIGFDGASPKLIDQWINHLPNLKRFKEQGILGETIPPIPAQTPVAWATFMTGKNPGNHGIFSFAFRKPGTYERQIIGTEMLKSKTLWRIMSDAGKKVGIINMPMCDAEDINGFIIPGFVSGTEGVPFPAKVQERIKRRFGVEKLTGDLDINTLDRVGSDPDSFFESVNHITDQMAEICLYLIQEEKWDLFCTVFMGMDRVQHFFWRDLDPTHPKHKGNGYSQLVKDIYIKADSIIGSFIESIDEDTLIIVVSDHGFCPVYREVIVNNYLEEEGFLRTKQGKIDLENSMAVSYGYGDIWLNVRGREPNGLIHPIEEYESVRTQISHKLRNIEIDGEKPIKDVKKREELYWGSHLSEAPDLTTVFNIGWQAARQPEIIEKNDQKRYVNDSPKWSGGHDGTHDPLDVPGLLGVIGPDVNSREEMRVHLWDIAPTILTWMKVAVPNDMDGKPFQLQSQRAKRL